MQSTAEPNEVQLALLDNISSFVPDTILRACLHEIMIDNEIQGFESFAVSRFTLP